MTNETIIIRGRVDQQEVAQAPVKPTVIVGIGGTGGDILLRVRKRFFEKYGALSQFPIVSYLWLDTDTTEKNIGQGIFTDQIAFSNQEKLMTTIPDTTVYTSDLNNHPHIKKWFYPGLSKLKTMTEGAGQIRAYSRLGFYHHFSEIRNALIAAKTRVGNVNSTDEVYKKHKLEANPNDLQVIVVFSVAGGTGSGMFLDLAFLVKELFTGNNLTTIGMVLMPGLFNPNEDRVAANGYAALKELEYYSYEHDYEVEWPDMVKRKVPGPPFNYTYLVDRTNQGGHSVDFSNREVIFNMVAENIFKDFTQSDFAGAKRGVRVNLDQYLTGLYAFRHLNENRESIIDQRFITRYGSFGLASISVPSDRVEMACAYRLAADVVDHWGSLTNSGFNAASLTEDVLHKVLPYVQMYQGNARAEGQATQRGDIVNALLDDGHDQGVKMHELIKNALAQAVGEAAEGVHKQRNQSMSQYLRGALEKELVKLRREGPDPQKWGDYARAIHFNREKHVAQVEQQLHQSMGENINEQHQSVGYAIALLRQVTNVLRDDAREYIPAFTRTRDESAKRAEQRKREVDQLFTEIAQHESKWSFQKDIILRADRERYTEMAYDYLRSLLRAQVYQAAVELCERVIAHIGKDEMTESGEVVREGLIAELYTLGGQLDSLKERLMRGYNHFREVDKNDLSLSLYDPADIEQSYLPRYLGAGDDARRQKESIGDQILQELQTSVMDLPKLVRQRGIEHVEIQIRDLARRPFRNVKKDFDVIETLWKKFPGDGERETKVRSIYSKSKFWLNGGGRPRSYSLTSEQQKIIVGIPQDSHDPIKVDELERLLQSRVQGPGEPSISVHRLSDRSEIVFYAEVGGIPVNWANSIADLRQKYLQKQAEGEELHTDANEIKFDDLVVLNEHERQELESAHECFLLGLIFGEIWPEHDAAGRVRYLWSEMFGLKKKTASLGIEMKAMAELISKSSTRDKILKNANERLDEVYRERDLLARFYALLNWYSYEVYTEKKIAGSDGVEHTEQSNMCRAVYKQIQGVMNFLEGQQRIGNEYGREFENLSRQYLNNLDPVAPLLIDGKRALRFEPEVGSGNGASGNGAPDKKEVGGPAPAAPTVEESGLA